MAAAIAWGAGVPGGACRCQARMHPRSTSSAVRSAARVLQTQTEQTQRASCRIPARSALTQQQQQQHPALAQQPAAKLSPQWIVSPAHGLGTADSHIIVCHTPAEQLLHLLRHALAGKHQHGLLCRQQRPLLDLRKQQPGWELPWNLHLHSDRAICAEQRETLSISSFCVGRLKTRDFDNTGSDVGLC